MLTASGAYQVISQWGSYIHGSDPGQCFYGFHPNDGRPVHEGHRLQCLAYLDGRLLPVAAGRDLVTLQSLRAWFTTCPTLDARS